jgi:hypothetical protein
MPRKPKPTEQPPAELQPQIPGESASILPEIFDTAIEITAGGVTVHADGIRVPTADALRGDAQIRQCPNSGAPTLISGTIEPANNLRYSNRGMKPCTEQCVQIEYDGKLYRAFDDKQIVAVCSQNPERPGHWELFEPWSTWSPDRQVTIRKRLVSTFRVHGATPL